MAKILLIDDDPSVLRLLEGFLEDLGYEVLGALDGEIGMELCRKEHPDLVVTDILMPEKDGLQVIRELKEAHPEVKVIAITGGGDFRDFTTLETAKKLGADYTLPKPFELVKLIDIVKTIFTDDAQDTV